MSVHHTLVNKIALNLRQPSWRRSEAWAAALGLTGREAEHFQDEMHLAAASPRVRALVERLAKSHRNSNR